LSGNSYYTILLLVVFVAIFYLIGIRPSQKQRRIHQEMLSSLSKGDHVVTAGGIHGVVKRMEDGIVVVEIAKGITIKVARRAIAEVKRDGSAPRLEPTGSTGRRTRNQPQPEEEQDTDIESTDDDSAPPSSGRDDEPMIAEEFKGESRRTKKSR
jgi:preprotein translocase subunit YajC